MKSTSPTMLVVRAFPRYAEFMSYATIGFPIVFAGGRKSVDAAIRSELPKHITSVYRPLVPYLLFDPIRVFRGNYTHRSWVVLRNLEPLVERSNIVNISDLYFCYGYHAARIAKRKHKKVIAILWENRAHHIATKIPPYSLFVRYLARSVDLFILRSKKSYEFTDSIGIPREKTRVIYQGINLARFKPQKSYLKGDVRFLYVGQVSKEKGVKDLLRAFALLQKTHTHIRLDIIGAGPQLDELKSTYENEFVVFHGFMKNTLTADYYNKAHVFVSPSISGTFGPFVLYEERFSYTLMEAQAAGCAIIATRCGGIPEEIGRENILVDQGDWEAIAQEMKRLVGDRNRLIKMGKFSRKRALSHFDRRKQSKQMEDSLRNLMYDEV